MSLWSEIVRVSESGTTVFGVINTDTLEFLIRLDHSKDVQCFRSNRKALIAGAGILYRGLTDILNTRKCLFPKLLTVS